MDEPETRKGWQGGHVRNLVSHVCPCGAPFYAPSYAKQKYCSPRCAHSWQRGPKEYVTLICAFCGREFERGRKEARSVLAFCNRKCKGSAQTLTSGILKPSRYIDGRFTYRARAFRETGARCAVCGYHEDQRMLDVDHIDGDRSNNDLSNLQVLCVWDHACKTRLGSVSMAERAGRSSK